MKNTFITISVLLLFLTSCRKGGEVNAPGNATSLPDSISGIMVADTIIYDVIVRNTNTDDIWADQRLKRLDHGLLIDNIFTMIYDEKATAYDHNTGEKLTVKQVENLEATDDFSRNDILMIQFREAWYMKPGEPEMTKKVISMVLGVGVYNEDGSIRGNRALFRVELNQ